jgi:hypothetical protein
VFACSGNRWKRSDDDYRHALAVVDACLRYVVCCKPSWWCLENPVGTLGRWLGKPRTSFHPYEYGDPYTKRTCLWGDFTMPAKRPVQPTQGSKISAMSSTWTAQRALTPAGFARAFLEANP